jgi:superfamily II DNA or RNA helicase
MLREVTWSADRSYRTGSSDEPMQFYIDGLCNSSKLDLLLGYFSSSAIRVLSAGFATFLFNGGNVRLVINNVLSQADKDALASGNEGELPDKLIDITDIKNLKRTLDEYGRHFFECLAWLIAQKRIQFKIIKPKNRKGIAHYKSGRFYDNSDSVGFKASCNFTAYGLMENLEELDAFLSWENGRSTKMIARQNHDFEEIFGEENENIEYLNVDDISVAIEREFGDTEINELLSNEAELLERRNSLLSNKNLRKSFEKAISKIENISREPRFPFASGPREYQKIAYRKWQENNWQGIFAMATGTGKTITALNCLLNEYKRDRTYRAVIVVPTTALLDQWKEECYKFNFRNVIPISSKSDWNESLSFFNTATKLLDASFIVIVTYASLSRPTFQSHFKQLPTNTLFIADEVHNIGSASIIKLLPQIHLQKRIGLSATPNRKFDDEGNQAIETFFNDRFPYIFSFSMKEALELNWLCNYTYHPHIVYLDERELKEYISISKQLLRHIDPKTHSYKSSPEVEKLLLARKRIIHKAVNKIPAFRSILSEEFRKANDLRFTLVYVPEGVEADYSLVDNSNEDDEDARLINEYTKVVSNLDDRIMVKQFTSNSDNREQILEQFGKGEIHVLTSMKCLDEGVDVPQSKLAIFCASTGNPRQFIQRRGRVLRKHSDKVHAIIHDLVVVPWIDSSESNYAMERNLVRKELERVVDFSSLSMNKMDTFSIFEEVLKYYNLNLNDLSN